MCFTSWSLHPSKAAWNTRGQKQFKGKNIGKPQLEIRFVFSKQWFITLNQCHHSLTYRKQVYFNNFEAFVWKIFRRKLLLGQSYVGLLSTLASAPGIDIFFDKNHNQSDFEIHGYRWLKNITNAAMPLLRRLSSSMYDLREADTWNGNARWEIISCQSLWLWLIVSLKFCTIILSKPYVY